MIFRFPVGPDDTTHALLESSSYYSNPTLTRQRKAFAKRFLQWQSACGHGAVVPGNSDENVFVGAVQSDRSIFILVDFYSTNRNGEIYEDEEDIYRIPTNENLFTTSK